MAIKGDPKLKLIVVDSIMFHFRFEFGERSKLPERAHRLNRHLSILLNLSQTENIAVVFTNHVATNLDEWREKSQPLGGNILSYLSGYIIKLQEYRSYIRATLKKSPSRGPASCRLIIDKSGFIDD
jgi:DNA repair protein RadA